jgi:hypothetical protein
VCVCVFEWDVCGERCGEKMVRKDWEIFPSLKMECLDDPKE